MAGAVARLMVEIVGDASKAVAAFKKTGDAAQTTEGAAKKTGASFKGIAAGIATGLVVAKVVDFGRASVTAAEESAVAHNRLVQTFRGAGDATGELAARAEKYAASLSKATGIDDEAISGAQALLATFHSVSSASAVQAGVFDRATAAAADLAAAGYGDLNSNAIQLGKALEDPVKGMTALARSGVTFTAAQKTAIAQMVKSGNQLGAQQLVLQNVEGQVKGTAAATATGTAKMATAWENFQESVGAALLPFITTIQTKLAGLFSFVSENSSWLVPLVVGLAVAIGTIIAVVKAIELFQAAVAATKVAILGFKVVWAALNSSFLASPIGLIIVAVVALIAVIVLLATKTRFFQTVWQAMSNAAVAAFRWVLGAAQTVWGWIRQYWPILVGVIGGPFTLAIALVYTFRSQILGALSYLVSAIGGIFGRVTGYITAPFITAFNIVKGVVQAAVGYITGLIHGLTATVAWGINAAKSVYNAFAHTWNAIEVKMPTIDTHIPGIGKIGGFTVGLPDLPIIKMQRGGLMTREGLIYAHAGEAIIPAGDVGRGPAVVVEHAHFAEQVDIDLFLKRVAWQLQAGRL